MSSMTIFTVTLLRPRGCGVTIWWWRGQKRHPIKQLIGPKNWSSSSKWNGFVLFISFKHLDLHCIRCLHYNWFKALIWFLASIDWQSNCYQFVYVNIESKVWKSYFNLFMNINVQFLFVFFPIFSDFINTAYT